MPLRALAFEVKGLFARMFQLGRCAMTRVLGTRSERLEIGDRIHAGPLVSYADQQLSSTALRDALAKPVTVTDVQTDSNSVALRTSLFTAHVPVGVLVARFLG